MVKMYCHIFPSNFVNVALFFFKKITFVKKNNCDFGKRYRTALFKTEVLFIGKKAKNKTNYSSTKVTSTLLPRINIC